MHHSYYPSQSTLLSTPPSLSICYLFPSPTPSSHTKNHITNTPNHVNPHLNNLKSTINSSNKHETHNNKFLCQSSLLSVPPSPSIHQPLLSPSKAHTQNFTPTTTKPHKSTPKRSPAPIQRIPIFSLQPYPISLPINALAIMCLLEP